MLLTGSNEGCWRKNGNRKMGRFGGKKVTLREGTHEQQIVLSKEGAKGAVMAIFFPGRSEILLASLFLVLVIALALFTLLWR
jgi:hypothetical protein